MDVSSVELLQLWEDMTERIRSAMPPAAYEFTFTRARPLAFSGDTLVVGVETDFAREWMCTRHLTLMCDALYEVTQREDLVIDVRVEPTDDAPGGSAHAGPGAVASAPAPAPPPPTGLPASYAGPNRSRFTFDGFVTGPSNRFAHAAAMAVAEAPARAYNPLFIYGGVGLGKTHLLHAVGNFINETTPELRTMYVSVETFTNQFINALRDGNMHSFKDRYRSVDVLLIDDIQSLAGREQTQEEFFHTFNALHDGGKQIIISSDRPPKEIATLEDRLRSRFEMGLITDIQPPDVETRIAILRKRAAAEGIHIAHPEVLSVIAERVSSNVRALEGALNRVIAHAALDGRPVSVELANDVLRNLYPADQGAITVEHVQREVCRYFGISHDELVGQKRTRRLVTPRQVAMFLTRDLTDSSLPAIGRAFGGRDHSTVLYAVQKITDQIKDEGEIYTAVTDLTTRLTGNS